jgi:hypothetical protein
MTATTATQAAQKPVALRRRDVILLWTALPLWLALFLTGTLVDSSPHRARFASFEGGVGAVLGEGALVAVSYTLTNVALLCLLAGILGMLARKANLGADSKPGQAAKHDAGPDSGEDWTAPGNSAVLRGFLVYLALIAGVLFLGDNPAQPTQIQYVRLAGLISLFGFVVNYRPALFGRLLQRAGSVIESSDSQAKAR